MARNLLVKIMQGNGTLALDLLVPKSTQTILKNELSVHLVKIVCCPKCFTLYHPPNLPDHCKYCETPKSKPCESPLFAEKNLFVGSSHLGKFQASNSRLRINQTPSVGIPQCTFIIQKLKVWLEWFLKVPTIEKEIDDWTQKAKELPAEVITDIQQGNAWKQLSWTNSWDDLRLVFSLFVDWFNPRGNKLAGKQESVGLIAMNCLNLPPKIRNKLAYTFVAGITPGPDSPSMTTITHLLKPLIDELVDLAEPFRLPTPSHPSGRLCQVKLLPLVGDLGGTHKVAGYASHSAKYYCSWCSSTNDKRPLLKIGDPRDGVEVHRLSDLWKSTQTLNGREKILRETGIRYSELNRLSYCDPVQHVALGILHNWFEGVLMHHFRERWGFQSLSFKEKRRQGDHQTSRKRARLDPSAPADDGDSSLESSSKDDNDVNLNQGENGGLFNEKDMDYFRNAMQDVVLPTKVGHLPSELGKSKCGKLKASQWYILFVYVVPLIVGEIFLDTLEDIDSNSNRFLIMENISNLIACTHYVASRKI